MADKPIVEVILERLDNHIEQQEKWEERQAKFEARVEPAILAIAKFEGKLIFVEKEIEIQIPKCESKFISIYNRLWWIVGIFLVALLGIVWRLLASGKNGG